MTNNKDKKMAHVGKEDVFLLREVIKDIFKGKRIILS